MEISSQNKVDGNSSKQFILLLLQINVYIEGDNKGRVVNRLFWQYNSVTEFIEAGKLSKVAFEQSRKTKELGKALLF